MAADPNDFHLWPSPENPLVLRLIYTQETRDQASRHPRAVLVNADGTMACQQIPRRDLTAEEVSLASVAVMLLLPDGKFSLAHIPLFVLFEIMNQFGDHANQLWPADTEFSEPRPEITPSLN